MKIPVELNSLLLKLLCYAPWFDERRRDTGGFANDAYLSNPIVSTKQ